MVARFIPIGLAQEVELVYEEDPEEEPADDDPEDRVLTTAALKQVKDVKAPLIIVVNFVCRTDLTLLKMCRFCWADMPGCFYFEMETSRKIDGNRTRTQHGHLLH